MDKEQIVRLIGEVLSTAPEMHRELQRLRIENTELKDKIVRLVDALTPTVELQQPNGAQAHSN